MPTKNQTEPTQLTEEEIARLMNEGEEEQLVNEEVGFPPYWNPGIGKMFKATVMKRDDRDPDFIRYHLLALAPVICAKGPADDSEEILVNEGEFFTCSAYAALPLDEYFGIDVKVITWRKRKLEGNEASKGAKRDLYEFKIGVTGDTKNMLDAARKHEAAIMREKAREARLAAMNFAPRQMKAPSKSTKNIGAPADAE